MTVNNLRRMVREMDRERATPSRLEPERLILPARPSATTRRICWDCRRVPEEALFAEWDKKWQAASAEERKSLPTWCESVGDTCPSCGGRLIEVTV